jgi:hypothetical protein
MTDKGYVGNDYALQEEIEEHILEQSVCAWEDAQRTGAGWPSGRSHHDKTPSFSRREDEAGPAQLRAHPRPSRSHAGRL